jgi:ferritin-like metal-binding protein YciE
MPDDKMEQTLVKYLQETHLMERHVHKMLDGMIATTPDEEMQADLRHHKDETERHMSNLEERLKAHHEDPSTVKEAMAVGGAMLKGMMDAVRSHKPALNARDGYVTEHLEIAAYELLERIAMRAADDATAEVARANRRDEQAMAEKIAARWDRVVDLTLAEEGIRASAGAAAPR